MIKNIKAFIVSNSMHKVDKSYESLLSRIQGDLANASKKDSARLEIPKPQIIWVGQRTIFRNFMEFPKALRREPESYYFI